MIHPRQTPRVDGADLTARIAAIRAAKIAAGPDRELTYDELDQILPPVPSARHRARVQLKTQPRRDRHYRPQSAARKDAVE
jgi:hypothetical protein